MIHDPGHQTCTHPRPWHMFGREYRCAACGDSIAYPTPPATQQDKPLTDATFTTTCARCAAQLESTDATADAASKAHEAVCFVVGDWVRITMPRNALDGEQWIEGALLSIARNSVGGSDGRVLVHAASGKRSRYVGAERSLSWGTVNTIRRIPRPEQAAKPPDFETERKRLEARAGVDPLDVKYDDVTLRELLRVNQRECRDGKLDGGPMLPLTVAQRAAVSAHWSAALRARIAASSERERLTVMIEQDCEDEPWR